MLKRDVKIQYSNSNLEKYFHVFPQICDLFYIVYILTYVTIRPILIGDSAFLLGICRLIFGYSIVYSRKIAEFLGAG